MNINTNIIESKPSKIFISEVCETSSPSH